MNAPQTRTIGGMSVTIAPLNGWDGYALLPELVKVLSPVLPEIKSAFASMSDEGEVDLDALDLVGIERAFRMAADALVGEKLPELMVRLLRNAVIVVPGDQISKYTFADSAAKASFGLAFSGERFWSAFTVAAFAFEVTYGNFSAAMQKAKGLARAAVAKE